MLNKKIIFAIFKKDKNFSMKIRLLIYLSLIISMLAFSSCSLSRRLKKAEQKYEIGEYYNAALIYKRILTKIPSNNKDLQAQVAFKMGNCYRLINNTIRADAAYTKAIRYKIKDGTAYLFYGEILRKTRKYNEAKSFYQKYLDYDENNTWASNALFSSDNAKEWFKVESPFIVKPAHQFDSRKGEFCPVIGDEDGSAIYLSSSRENIATGAKISKITGQRNNDIFIIKKNSSGKWDDPTPLPTEINSEYDEGACCFSPDGKTMYFTQCRSIPGVTLGAEVYASQRAGGEWTVPKKVVLFEDSTITIAHPAISPDSRYLYFVSDKEGGYGGKDIWRVLKLNDVEWGTPENLGKDINTEGDEMFPAFKADGTLYFSSNGLPGFGGLDIFKATHNPDKPEEELYWVVKNMLAPVNSSDDDFGITFIGNKNNGYFSSNRNQPKGFDKIYSFVVPEIEYFVEGKVVDNKDEPLSDATVRIIGDDGTNIKVKVKKDGSFRLKLDKNVKYAMLATARGHINEKIKLSTEGVKESKTIDTKFKLASIGKPVNIDDILYEFGKYTLTKESEKALNGLVKMLNDNPHITIEIGAHTDMVGSGESNLLLSTKRAESVVEFLIKSGIEKERLAAKGYGETKPIKVDAAMVQKYDFMKEDDVLNEEYIQKLDEKQKEIVNRINRRTEFMVIKTTYKLY